VVSSSPELEPLDYFVGSQFDPAALITTVCAPIGATIDTASSLQSGVLHQSPSAAVPQPGLDNGVGQASPRDAMAVPTEPFCIKRSRVRRSRRDPKLQAKAVGIGTSASVQDKIVRATLEFVADDAVLPLETLPATVGLGNSALRSSCSLLLDLIP
jgi:hypothetical protein